MRGSPRAAAVALKLGQAGRRPVPPLVANVALRGLRQLRGVTDRVGSSSHTAWPAGVTVTPNRVHRAGGRTGSTLTRPWGPDDSLAYETRAPFGTAGELMRALVDPLAADLGLRRGDGSWCSSTAWEPRTNEADLKRQRRRY